MVVGYVFHMIFGTGVLENQFHDLSLIEKKDCSVTWHFGTSGVGFKFQILETLLVLGIRDSQFPTWSVILRQRRWLYVWRLSWTGIFVVCSFMKLWKEVQLACSLKEHLCEKVPCKVEFSVWTVVLSEILSVNNLGDARDSNCGMVLNC